VEAYELDNYTYKDYLEIDKTISNDDRCELIFGHIYMMAGASRVHQDVVGNIFFLLKQLQKDKGCSSVIAPFDIKLKCDNSVNIVQPDVMLFCEDEELPCAVYEVLSPSTAHKDKSVKKELYECFGIKNYLIIDPVNRYVDSFILKDDKLIYDKCYGEEDKLVVKCLDESIEVRDFFE
jgi:Uma2 family endonuclease